MKGRKVERLAITSPPFHLSTLPPLHPSTSPPFHLSTLPPLLVSIICLCYNHAPYIRIALESVFAQTYTDWELWIVDDASTDNSAEIIQQWIAEKRRQGCRQAIHFLQNTENKGNCRSFNLAYQQTKGVYLLDLAGDDVLLPTRLEVQVALFETLPTQYGVLFSNAKHINEAGEELSTHHAQNEQVPTGDVYEALFRRYFICTPTMLMRRQVLDDLGGYDETLSYEDFDFWVRSARKYLYHYHPDITTLKRKVQGSLSAQFYQTKRNTHLRSTLVILQKALDLNNKPAENEALQICLAYHYRQAFFMQDFKLAQEYDALWRSVPDARFPLWAQVVRVLNSFRVPVFWLYRLYLKRL